MTKDIIGVVVSFAYFFIVVLLPRLFTRMKDEHARKFVHIMIGNWWFVLIAFISNAYCALIVPLVFVVINYVSVKRNNTNGLLASLERKDEKSKSYGIIIYPVSLVILVCISYILTDKHYLGGIGAISLAYGDGFAAIIGKKWPVGKLQIGKNEKTLSGSISMLVITIILTAIYLILVLGFPFGKTLPWIIISAFMSVLAEAVTPNGFDNLTVPLIAVLTYMACAGII